MCIAIVGCTSNRQEIKHGVWDKDSLITITLNVEDATQPCDIDIDLRTGTLYPASNLWLFINTQSPDNILERDTLQCILQDESGNSFGETSGELCDYYIPWKKNVRFPKNGEYKFTLQHGMRIERLPFVLEIGLRIQPHQN